ncbi:hypothetical protein ACFQ4Z_06380 [Oceanobacillus oncorhynchi subsp. oncorhynchi]|uniref:hypothetical protein n=1 Tax=Oceanobacillus TaxID=182709 RepID=UPI0030D99428
MVRTDSMEGKRNTNIYFLTGIVAIMILAAFPEIYSWFFPFYFLVISIICFVRNKTKAEKVFAYVSLLLAIGSMILFPFF